jgi:cytochrome c
MVPGTNMSFAGIPRGKERADVITFLNTKSDKPVDLPKQAAAPAAEKQAAAPGGQGDKPQAAPAAAKPH